MQHLVLHTACLYCNIHEFTCLRWKLIPVVSAYPIHVQLWQWCLAHTSPVTMQPKRYITNYANGTKWVEKEVYVFLDPMEKDCASGKMQNPTNYSIKLLNKPWILFRNCSTTMAPHKIICLFIYRHKTYTIRSTHSCAWSFLLKKSLILRNLVQAITKQKQKASPHHCWFGPSLVKMVQPLAKHFSLNDAQFHS